MMTAKNIDDTILPDGERLDKVRLNAIKSGYDHYWRFHQCAEEWSKLGCPICKKQLKRFNH